MLVGQTAEVEIKGAVYTSFKDFVKETPSITVMKKKGNYFNVSIATDIINIKSDNKTLKYLPGSIYAYNDAKNIYRYYKVKGDPLFVGYFKIIEVSQLIIYEKLVYFNTHPGGRSEKGKGLVRKLFYSVNLESPILELNHKNLSLDFKDNAIALSEINVINNSCKTCLQKKTSDGFVVNTRLNDLAKRYPDKFKQKAISGSPIIIPAGNKKTKVKGKGRQQAAPL